MVDILVRIKRTVLAGRYAFSEKARIEMEADGITELDVAESSPRQPSGVSVRDPIDELGGCHGVFEGQAHTGTRRGSLLFPDLVQEGPMRAAMGKERFLISACPSCGSPAIRKVKGEWTGRYKGMSYSVGALEYYACPNCQEKVYPPEAMRRIQEASPAYSRPRRVRRASGPRA